MRRCQLAAMAALVVCAAAAPLHASRAAPLHRYTVTVDASLQRLEVAACFDGAAPEKLSADDGAARFLQRMTVRNAPSASVAADGRDAVVAGAPRDACVDYTVALQPRVRGQQTGGPETRLVGADLLTAVGDWLWRPVLRLDGEDIELQFVLPPGVSVSAPWPRVPARAAPTYRLAGTPTDWPAVVAFGRFEPVVIDVPGARAQLAIVGDASAAQRDRVRGWIERTMRGVAGAYGKFPVAALQVIVAPTGQRSRSPVPWAYVARGGGAAVHLFVDLERDARELERDWTLTHEMSHLFLPYLESRDAWLFEGLPTYLQNVLMARSGAISEEEAWRRMHEGFARGAAVGAGLSLREASERMGRGGLYLRAYWGGAALLLAADLRLRSRGDPNLSLDSVLAGLRECCADASRRYGAAELIARMDAASGTTVFSTLAAELVDRAQFPDYERLFRDFGITMLGGHPILEDGPPAALRAAIMARR